MGDLPSNMEKEIFVSTGQAKSVKKSVFHPDFKINLHLTTVALVAQVELTLFLVLES